MSERLRISLFGSVGLVVLGLAAWGCSRAPLEWNCSQLSPGDLVISEIRGSQPGMTDTFGQWVEIYNPGESTVILTGLKLKIRDHQGGGETDILLRENNLSLEPDSYFVMGRFSYGDFPAHVDYGYEDDFEKDLYEDGLLQLYTCGIEVDKVVYHDLPTRGSLSFDGDIELTAAANDEEEDWCVDLTEPDPGDGGVVGIGIPGTPREINRPCE